MPELFCGVMQSKTAHRVEHCGHNVWSCEIGSAEMRVRIGHGNLAIIFGFWPQ
jgi:hypothetical protein